MGMATLLTYVLGHVRNLKGHRYESWPAAAIVTTLASSCREDSEKIWLGLNFYGREFEGKAKKADVLAHDYDRIVEDHKPKMKWDEELREHVLTYKKDGRKRKAYYPSKESVQVRSLRAGIG